MPVKLMLVKIWNLEPVRGLWEDLVADYFREIELSIATALANSPGLNKNVPRVVLMLCSDILNSLH